MEAAALSKSARFFLCRAALYYTYTSNFVNRSICEVWCNWSEHGMWNPDYEGCVIWAAIFWTLWGAGCGKELKAQFQNSVSFFRSMQSRCPHRTGYGRENLWCYCGWQLSTLSKKMYQWQPLSFFYICLRNISQCKLSVNTGLNPLIGQCCALAE